MSTYMRPTSDYPEIGLDYLYSRCTECDGCLLWKMQMIDGPVTNIMRKRWKVRHLVWRMVHRRSPQADQIPMPTKCGQERCIHPDHLTLVKRNSHARGKKMTLLHRAHIAETKRVRSGKIDLQKAEEIRASSEPLIVLAARHGISVGNAHRIKHGEAWIDYRSPFAQLIKAPA